MRPPAGSARPRLALPAGGPAGVPDVLANAHPHERTAEVEHRRSRALPEVAVLIKDAVVRQVALVIPVQDLPTGDDGAGVEEIPVEVDEARRAGYALGHRPRELGQTLQVLLDKARAHQQVLRRVARDYELRQSDEYG